MGSCKSLCSTATDVEERKKITKGNELQAEDIWIDTYERNLQWNSIFDALSDRLSEKQIKSLYICMIHTSLNYIGIPQNPYNSNSAELIKFCNRLFKNIKKDDKKELAQKVKHLQPSPVKLYVTVVSANGLQPADPNGLSDAYCKLWIRKECMQETDVVHESLDPEWNQTFSFNLDNLKTDILNLEVWDEDPKGIAAAMAQIRNVKSFRGCLSCLREIRETLCGRIDTDIDDFLGFVQIPMKSIPSTGLVESFHLQPRDALDNTDYGAINLNLYLIVKDSANHFYKLLRHMVILKISLNYIISKEKENILDMTKWFDLIPAPALTLLYQHSLQAGINVLEVTISRWLVCLYVCIREKQRINLGIFYRLLLSIYDLKKTEEFIIDSNLKKELPISFHEYFDYCKSRLGDFRGVFDLDNEMNRAEFQELLVCLILTNKFTGGEDITSKMNPVIQEEIISWHRNFFKEVHYHKGRREADCQEVARQLEDSLKNLQTMDSVFKDVWPQSYTSVVYSEIDAMLENNLRKYIRQFSYEFDDCFNQDVESSLSYIIQIYSSLRFLGQYMVDQLPENKETLAIESFHHWFGKESLFRWLDWLKVNTLEWIDISVQSEEFVKADRFALCGRSARDAKEIIDQKIITLWKTLAWPELDATLKTIDVASDLCNYFASKTEEKIKEDLFCDADGRFDVTPQLCVAISNFFEIASYTDSIKSELIQNTEKDLLVDLTPAFSKMAEMKSTLMNCIERICADAIQKMDKEIRQHIKEIIKNTDSSHQELAASNICDYVRSNMRTAKKNLFNDTYVIFAKLTWRAFLENVDQEIDRLGEGIINCMRRKSKRYIRLMAIVTKFKDTLHADGHGLDESLLMDSYFSSVVAKLEERCKSN